MIISVEEELYTQGSCHVFAIAAHRCHENPRGFRVVFDGTTGDVTHVYAVAGAIDAEIAIDILGSRPVSDVAEDCRKRFGSFLPVCEDFLTEEDLSSLIEQGTGGDHDSLLPLHSLDQADIDQAIDVYHRLFTEPPIPQP